MGNNQTNENTGIKPDTVYDQIEKPDVGDSEKFVFKVQTMFFGDAKMMYL